MQKNLKCKDLRYIDYKKFVYVVDADEAVICEKDTENLNILGKLPLEEFMEFMPSKSISSPILPRNCIQISPINNGYLMCFEFNPRTLKIEYCSRYPCYEDATLKRKVKGPWQFELPLPYIQFYIRVVNNGNFSITNFTVTVSNKSVREDENTPVYYFPMPNIYGSGEICWGVNNLPPSPSYAEAAELAINIFFNSPFNDHFGPRQVPAALNTDMGTGGEYIPIYFQNWVKKFGTNPLDILKIDWYHRIDKGKTYKEVRQYVETH